MEWSGVEKVENGNWYGIGIGLVVYSLDPSFGSGTDWYCGSVVLRWQCGSGSGIDWHW